MATYPLDMNSLRAPRRWRGVVRFFAWLTVFGVGAPATMYYLASLHPALADSVDLTGSLRYAPFLLLRKLFAGLADVHFNAILLLFAPLMIAALSALFSLRGPYWRRIMLALLSLLAAAFNLFTCLSLVLAMLWDGAMAGVIDILDYAALSVSLVCVVVAFGCLFLALAGALRWPRLSPWRAYVVRRWWAWLSVAGAALLIAAYFTAWGSWRSPGHSLHRETIVPIGLALAGSLGAQANALLLLFAAPVIAAASAFLTLRAPRWKWRLFSLLSLLMGVLSMVMCLMLLGWLFLRPGGAGVLAIGGALGLGASAIIAIAPFGLLSLPSPERRALTTRLITESWPLRAEVASTLGSGERSLRTPHNA